MRGWTRRILSGACDGSILDAEVRVSQACAALPFTYNGLMGNMHGMLERASVEKQISAHRLRLSTEKEVRFQRRPSGLL
jgi:hypothetical protein